MSELAAVVRGVRVLFGWSVKEFGERSGISQNTLRTWESLRSRSLMTANEEKLLRFLESEGVRFSQADGRLTISVPASSVFAGTDETAKASTQ